MAIQGTPSTSRIRLAVVGVLLAFGALTATAANPERAAADAAIEVNGDLAANTRYVSYLRPDGVPVVLDTRNSAVRVITGADDCRPEDTGGGRVLLICEEPSIYAKGPPVPPRTASVKGGRSVPVPHYVKGQSFVEIGRFWLKGRHPCGGACPPSTLYKDWRNGRQKSIHPFANNASYYRNLNTRGLRRLPEMPFEPRIDPGPGPVYRGYSSCYNRRVVVTDTGDDLRLWRSPHRSEIIGRGSVFSFECWFDQSLRIGAGLITWSKGRHLFAYDISSGFRIERRLKKSGWAAITPVRGGIVTSEPTGRKAGGHAVTRIVFTRVAD